ncbi:MAG: ECF-type sigma factor [Acidobacteriota bacterium]
MDEPSADITQILLDHGRGDKEAFGRLMPLVYEDLRRIARRQIRQRSPGRTLDTTGLVHEAYLKMVDQTRAGFKDRGHFFAISARAMRQILVDYARNRLAAKRGGGQHHTSLDEAQAAIEMDAGWVMSLHEALNRLASRDERLVRIVECRFFAGLTEDETAEALEVSTRTVQRDWMRARIWLKEEMKA